MNQGLDLLFHAAPSPPNAGWFPGESRGAVWTWEENKCFEIALAFNDKDTPDRWLNVAAMTPGKTVDDVIRQYRDLESDIGHIEAGRVPVPTYRGDFLAAEWGSGLAVDGWRKGAAARSSDQEKRKGVPWTEDEHRQFLMGLQKYGKGDWRNISHNFVTTRTPTQVASHAQKYFIRQSSGGKDKRRSSIHDITTVSLSDADSPPPPPSPVHASSVAAQGSLAMAGGLFTCWESEGRGLVLKPTDINPFDPAYGGAVDGYQLGPYSAVFPMPSSTVPR